MKLRSAFIFIIGLLMHAQALSAAPTTSHNYNNTGGMDIHIQNNSNKTLYVDLFLFDCININKYGNNEGRCGQVAGGYPIPPLQDWIYSIYPSDSSKPWNFNYKYSYHY